METTLGIQPAGGDDSGKDKALEDKRTALITKFTGMSHLTDVLESIKTCPSIDELIDLEACCKETSDFVSKNGKYQNLFAPAKFVTKSSF